MTTDPTPDTGGETSEPVDTPDTDTVDWKAEAEKYKALHRKQEERAKANAQAARELETLKKQSMSDQERAGAEAVAAAKADAVRGVAGKLVDAEIRVAAAGRNLDVDALLDGVDRSKFLTEDGDPDREAVGAWLDRIAPQTEAKPTAPDLGQGARGGPPALNSSALERDLRAALGIN